MSATQAERHPVDRLAEEFVQRYRRGERPAIADYTSKYPELASELQEILAVLVLIEEHGRMHVQPGGGTGRSSPICRRRCNWATIECSAKSAAAEWESSMRQCRNRSGGMWCSKCCRRTRCSMQSG